MRLAGLRYSGKGANRTILDCMFRPVQAEQAVVSAAAGSRAPAASPGRSLSRRWGWLPAADEKGLGIVTTASSADHPTRRDFLFVATGAAAAVGGVATLWPLVAQMNPG